MFRQVVCLIEASPEGAPGMHRHRHHRIGGRKEISASLKHQPRQGPRQCPPLVVLERVHDGFQRTRVQTSTPGYLERGRLGQTRLAQPERRGVGGQLIAAQVAERAD
jgi:hypothetical protein